MDRSIEVRTEPMDPHALHVRLCDGGQVLAARVLDELNDDDYTTWQFAGHMMLAHNALVAGGAGYDERESSFAVVIGVLFPEFGTVPEGVKL